MSSTILARPVVRRVGAVFAVLALALVGVLTHIAPALAEPLFPNSGRTLNFSSGSWAKLYALKAPRGGDASAPVWCVDLNANSPNSATDSVIGITTLTSTNGYTPSDLLLTVPQAAWVLNKYEQSKDADTLAAIAYLVHANFEQSKPGPNSSRSTAQNVAWLTSNVKKDYPALHNLAVSMVNEARNSAAVGYEAGGPTGELQRHGTINGIGVHPQDGNRWLAGIDMTVTLNGPAVFTDTGTQTWTGKSQSSPLTLQWKATGNGDVTYSFKYKRSRQTMTLYGAKGGVQATLTSRNRPASDPETETVPGRWWRVVYDFQPLGTSSVTRQEVNYTGEITDTLTTAVDKNYGSGSWINGDDGQPVTVHYRATAYLSRSKPAESEAVPEGAEKIGSVLVDANGEGQHIQARLTTAKRGWVTWVWEALKADQEDQAIIHADWNDHYGLNSETSKENFDFRPIGTSNVAEAKIIDHDSIPSDTFVAEADPAYRDGEWTRIINGDASFDEGEYVPVTYTATAYRVDPETLYPTGHGVPASASVLGSVDVVAHHPGEKLKATLDKPVGPGFLYWVWRVDPGKQGENLKYISAGWEDEFASPDETTSDRYPMEVDSTLSIRKTKSGIYLVDDVWVTGLPANHGNFLPDYGFKEDTVEMDHTLLFFPEGLEVSDENASKAEVIAKVSLPAKNGFYPSVGSTEFKVKGNEPGTYVVQSSFAGDDRVEPFTSSVTDTTEQYVVTEGEEPQLHTTARDKADGDKTFDPTAESVTITDEVAYTGLIPGKEYTVSGVLMDQATGVALTLEDGTKITGETVFTPQEASGSVSVEFTVPGAVLAGRTTVVFETLYRDGKIVGAHTDITDEGQTVHPDDTPELKTTATDKADGDKTIDPTAESVTITDEVCYTKLTPGKEYTVSGVLMNKATGEALPGESGEPITGETTFTPDSAEGCVNVEFTAPGHLFKGKTTVVFENLYRDGLLVAAHADINDEGQTVRSRTPELPHTGASIGALGMLAGLLGVAGLSIVGAARRRV